MGIWLELVVFAAAGLGWGFWELWSLRRANRRAAERDRAAADARRRQAVAQGAQPLGSHSPDSP